MHYRWRLSSIARVLADGAVIAYPTEGVWGLGCRPEQRAAVEHILTLKQRSWRQGLILVAADIEQFAPLIEGLPPADLRTLETHWPGPVTVLVPDLADRVPPWVKGRHETVALRVSDHPVVRDLCLAAGSPLVSTSANVSGAPAARNELAVRAAFGNRVDCYINGETGGQQGPSRIIDLRTGQQLR